MGEEESRSDKKVRLQEGQIVRQRWRVIKKLGGGSFGTVFKVADVKTNEEAAMKAELIQDEDDDPMIQMEVAVLKSFRNFNIPHPNICDYLDSGVTSTFRYMVMKLVGPDLGNVRMNCPKQLFSESTIVRVGIQCVNSVEQLHQIGFIHRDIKPPNYAIGLGEKLRSIYLLDFGLSRQYVNREGKLRPPRFKAGFRGTVRYASLNAHLRKDLGRHDDLWCIVYMLIELHTGKLPWKKMNDKEAVGALKKNTPADKLLEGMPKEFHQIVNELQGLQFRDTPNYEWFRQRFADVMKRKAYRDTDPFDWERIGSKAATRKPDKKKKEDEKRHKEKGVGERSRLSQ